MRNERIAIAVAFEMQNMQRLYTFGELRDLLTEGDAIKSLDAINVLVAEKILKAFDYHGKILYLFTGKLPSPEVLEKING